MAVKARTSLATAIEEIAARDPVLANLVAVVGPIGYPPRNPDGHFGALAEPTRACGSRPQHPKETPYDDRPRQQD